MDQLLNSLVVPSQDGYISAATALKEAKSSQNAMAVAVSSPHNMQDFAFRSRDNMFDDMDGFNPPPSAQRENRENEPPPVSGFAAMANLQPIDEFDRLFPYEPKKPKAKLIALASSKSNSDNIIKFQQLCDRYAIRPEFTFFENSTSGFNAKVVFDTCNAETTEGFSSKKEAKDAVCKLALALLPALDEKAGKKRKSSEVPSESPVVDRSENWVGILHENAQQKKAFTPTYQELCTESYPIQFGCTITIVGGPLTPFGTGLGPFNSKSDAKVAAAREAVLWLRGAGLLQTPVKRQKLTNTSPSPEPLPGHCGLTQSLQDINVEFEKPDSPSSLPQHMHNLVASLGFQTPRWHHQKSAAASGVPLVADSAFVDMALYFHEVDVAVEPGLAGPVGKVERVFGLKRAKEECCKKVLPLLEEIQRSRRA